MSSSTRARRWAAPTAACLGLGALVVAAACVTRVDGTAHTDEPPPAAELTDEGSGVRHPGHHFGKPVDVVIETTLADGDLSPAQAEAVRAIGAELRALREGDGAMREQLRAAALDVVRADGVDSELFGQAVAEATAVIEERCQAGADALEELHALLAADQRAAVAEALRERIAERSTQRHRGHHARRFEKIAAHLMLTHFQLDRLAKLRDELLGRPRHLRPSPEELGALVDAFEGDDFAEALARFQAEKMAIVRERLSRAGEHADTALAVLDPGQRKLLADLIERGPEAVLVGEEP